MVEWGQMKKWAEDNGVPDDAVITLGNAPGAVESFGNEVLNDLDQLEYPGESIFGKRELILIFRRQGMS
jgi:hypothetical protein